MEILKPVAHVRKIAWEKPRMLYILTVFLVGVLFLFVTGTARAEERSPSEWSIKLAYLHNFAKFIQWPPGGAQSEEFIIGIVGNIGQSVPNNEKREVGGKRVVIRSINKIDHLRDCQIVFVPSTERAVLPQVMKALEGRPVLTVGDFDGFLRGGGMINLVTVKGRIAFDVNVGATKRAGVTIGYQLLRLARELVS